MRYFFFRRIPNFDRVLLIESGSRYIFDNLLPGLNKIYGEKARFDLVTCYPGLPEGFRPEHSKVYRVGDYIGRASRTLLYRELAANRYSIVGMICAGEPIMTKWKWALALRLRAKVFVLNENGDYFWLDRTQWKTIWHFLLYRAGLAGGEAVVTIAWLVFLPFTLLYLLLYATAVHLRKKVRT
jgi:hypothetical protein